MVQRIDKELLRKRAEHNDGELSSLREVTLHQYDIEKIENLDVYCRHLEILFLQNNQIAKIENLNKLKELKYLQLALNNITKIENLEGCEALEKLDLTVNFVEDPLDVESLKGNEELKDLYLLGNPCAKKEGYREYVITALPQLKMLDGRDITRTERIEAAQLYDDIRLRFLQDKEASSDQLGTGDVTITDNGPDVAEAIGDVDAAAKRHNYQTTTTAHTPSARLSAARDLALLKNPPVEPKPAPIPAPLFTASGRLLQKNQGKWTYNFTSSSSTTTLHVHLSKFIDTSLLDVEVERDWIRVTAKGKVLQLVLEEPVQSDGVICERSTVSGWLAVTMIKEDIVGDLEDIRRKEKQEEEKAERKRRSETEKEQALVQAERKSRMQDLENFVPTGTVNVGTIVKENEMKKRVNGDGGIMNRGFIVALPEIPLGFEDDPDVPPLC